MTLRFRRPGEALLLQEILLRGQVGMRARGFFRLRQFVAGVGPQPFTMAREKPSYPLHPTV